MTVEKLKVENPLPTSHMVGSQLRNVNFNLVKHLQACFLALNSRLFNFASSRILALE
jgi:hypothetical protein